MGCRPWRRELFWVDILESGHPESTGSTKWQPTSGSVRKIKEENVSQTTPTKNMAACFFPSTGRRSDRDACSSEPKADSPDRRYLALLQGLGNRGLSVADKKSTRVFLSYWTAEGMGGEFVDLHGRPNSQSVAILNMSELFTARARSNGCRGYPGIPCPHRPTIFLDVLDVRNPVRLLSTWFRENVPLFLFTRMLNWSP